MSNIVKTENLETLYLHLEHLRNKGIDKAFIANFLDDFIIKDVNGKSLVSYSLDLTKSFTPNYDIDDNSVNISYDGFIMVISKYYNQFLKIFNSYSNVSDDLKNYLAIFILSHELEHAYQACIRNNLIVSPSIMLESCYKMFFDPKSEVFNYSLKDKLRYIIREIMYKIPRGHLALERNANLESADLIYKLASLESNEDLIKLIEELRMFQALIGYNFNGPGVLVNTAKIILQFDKLKGFEETDVLSFEEKVRYGLPINEDELYHLIQVVLQSGDDRFLTLKKRMKIKYVSK